MELKSSYLDFEKEIADRGIEFLVHFTPTINLLSIFEWGKILSRSLIEQFGANQKDLLDYVEFVDKIRLDNKNYINLSIQHPNSFLFTKFRQRTINDCHIKWCVLKIDKKYIYHKDTLFSVTNAANGHNKITGDIDKFKKMFEPSLQIITAHDRRNISRDDLPDQYPTDEQAEVLVKDEIPISDIIQVCFNDDNDLASAKAALSDYDTRNFVVNQELFNNLRR